MLRASRRHLLHPRRPDPRIHIVDALHRNHVQTAADRIRNCHVETWAIFFPHIHCLKGTNAWNLPDFGYWVLSGGASLLDPENK